MLEMIKRIWQQGTDAAMELIIAVLVLVWYIRHIINGRLQ